MYLPPLPVRGFLFINNLFCKTLAWYWIIHYICSVQKLKRYNTASS